MNSLFPGQREAIAEILGNPLGDTYDEAELFAMDRTSLLTERDRLRAAHASNDTRVYLPSRWVMFEGKLQRDWAVRQMLKLRQEQAGRMRWTGPRYRAVVWDSQQSMAVYVGTFKTEAERDAAVQAAKVRRAIGLPVKMD